MSRNQAVVIPKKAGEKLLNKLFQAAELPKVRFPKSNERAEINVNDPVFTQLEEVLTTALEQYKISIQKENKL